MLFAHIQYPIVDLRPFLNDEYKRELPVFPAPMANTWLRNFGHVRERRTDTSPYYIAENYFCDAHNAVKFEKLPLFTGKKQFEYAHGRCDGIEYPLFNKVCEFRRFRSDGNLKSCFEIGIATNPIYDDIYTAYSELSQIFVNVKSYTEERKKRVPLLDLGEHICKLYEDSTSIKETPVKTIYSGRPLVVFIDHSISDFEEDDDIISHREFYRMGIDLKHSLRYNKNFWIIVPWEYHYDKKLLASIRRALLAISLEKETLLSAYNFLLLNYGKGYINETKVLRYIKKTQKKLLSQVRFDIPQSSIVDILFKIDFEHNKASYYDIINLISKVGDKYIVNDFNRLFIKLDFDEWKKEITKQLDTIDDKDLRRKIKQLRDICIAEDKDKFWAFLYKYKVDEIIRNFLVNIFSSWFTRYFWGL